MPNIAQVIQSIIESQPFIEEALFKGIINYTALADDIKPTIELEVNHSVSISAISMALRRYVKNNSSKYEYINAINLKNSDITIRTDLFELTVKKIENEFQKLRKIYDTIELQPGDFFTFTNGLYEITIISNNRYHNEIRSIFKSEEIIKLIEELAAITIKLPIEAVGDPGYFYIFTKLLAWKNISIVEVVSTLTELTLILFESDVSVAYNSIKEFLKIELE